MEPALRDEVVAFVAHWTALTQLPMARLLRWLGLSRGKYHAWRARGGTCNGHNGAQSPSLQCCKTLSRISRKY